MHGKNHTGTTKFAQARMSREQGKRMGKTVRTRAQLKVETRNEWRMY